VKTNFALWGISVEARAPSQVVEAALGSHHVFRHPNHAYRVVVPMHSRDLAKGTLNQIVNASGLDRAELLKLL
jgi:HicA toxin of bacterial toxin-antitoxin,